MNEEQEEAVQAALRGHSFLLTGAAGTGKSFTTKKIVEQLIKAGKKVLVTSSTGISCMPLASLHAKTLHSTFGLRDGRYSTEQLLYLFDHDDSYQKLKKAICDSNTLVIDEISMVSMMVLEHIHAVACHVRQSNVTFGGLQRIFVGDFYQLPPVPSATAGDEGKHCFYHPEFHKIIPHTIRLMQVV
jgi:ATP-dependent DNA helicase PIF1